MDKKVPFVDEVEIFNSTFGKPNNYEPTVPADTKLTNFVVDFIKEETEELAEAIENGDIVEVLDAICDLLYVAVGNATMVFGVKDRLMDAFAEVQASNMSKSCATIQEAQETITVRSVEHGPCYFRPVGSRFVVYRESDDKVMKSVNYFAPNLKQFFTEEEIKQAYADRKGNS
jgi:NTP pyrophosphatase (non-canonical NTP hydrolase)